MLSWDIHPAAAGLDPVAQITADSDALAEAAERNFEARVEHCPDWSVRDLVWHVLRVHHFWGEIVRQGAQDPSEIARPERPADTELLAAFRDGARRLADVLRAADPAAPVWTWAPQHDAGFVIRHQVQEAAVHRWDAENAAGRPGPIDRPAAVDAVEEFLTFSTNVPDAAPLRATVALAATDTDAAWVVEDGADGALRWRRGAEVADATVRGTASDLLLWLYERVPLSPGGDPAVLDRFRAHADSA